MHKEFVKVCPVCLSDNIKPKTPQNSFSYQCLACGNTEFVPLEIERGKLSEWKKLRPEQSSSEDIIS